MNGGMLFGWKKKFFFYALNIVYQLFARAWEYNVCDWYLALDFRISNSVYKLISINSIEFLVEIFLAFCRKILGMFYLCLMTICKFFETNDTIEGKKMDENANDAITCISRALHTGI